MHKMTKTVYGESVALANLFGHEYSTYLNTTLNERYEVENIATTQNPKLLYYGVGLNYDPLVDNANAGTSSIKHKPTDANVYIPLPFLMVSRPLTAEENEKYRLKVPVDIDGVIYTACYIKVIDTTFETSDILEIVKTEGTDGYILNDFNTADVLNPIPGFFNDDYPDDLTYVGVSTNVEVTLTPSECADLRNASDLLYGNDRTVLGSGVILSESERYTIGEFMFCSGVDNEENDEASFIQPNYFRNIKKVFEAASVTEDNPVGIRVNLGTMLPMITART